MQIIETVLDRAVFFDEESSFAIFRSPDGFGVKGNVIDLPEHLIGVKISFTGDFSTSKYGKEFNFTDYKIIEGELFFFLSKIAKGIKRSIALEISNKYADSFEEVIVNSPQELLSIKGIGAKKLANLIHAWDESKDLKKLSGKLSPFGITSNLIVKIYRHFGTEANTIIDTNPYRLTEIRGIGFKKADEVAHKIGLTFNDPRRAEACLLFCIGEYMIGSGHTIISESELFTQFLKESTIEDLAESLMSRDDYEVALSKLLRTDKIVSIDGGFYSLKSIYDAEISALSIIHSASSRQGQPILEDVSKYIQAYEDFFKIQFGEKQRSSIAMAASNKKIFSLTGYAGTGKTSVSKAILKMYEDKYGRDVIACCALSGIAANRVKKQSGYASSTIYTLLGFDPSKGGFSHDENNKLEQLVILLDEASMVDVKTFDALLRAIDFNRSNLILIGDPAQLPPVGAGELFSDILSLGMVDNVTLDKIYRQGEGKVITTFAQDVRNGVVPDLRYAYEDFEFVDISIPGYWELKNTLKPKEVAELNEQNHHKIIDFIIAEARAAIPHIQNAYRRDAWEGLTRFQIIVPMKNGAIGTKNLNLILQDVINPKRNPEKDILVTLGSGREFRMRDKVIHLQNKKMVCVGADEFKLALLEGREFDTFETKIFNGQIGVLFKGNIEEDEQYVYYPNEGFIGIYSKGDFAGNIIDLAYALTGHKTQGSEFHEVILPIVNAHWMMLNNKLLYTQMTRAKEKLLIVGEKYAFSSGCKRSSETIRNTIAKLQLKDLWCNLYV